MTEKLHMLRLILFTALLCLLGACGQKSQVTKTEFVIAGISGAATDTVNGALMITAYNPGTKQIVRKKMGASAQDLTLPNGLWYFSALYWDQSALEGAILRCGLAKEDLNGSEISINLSLTQDDCKNEDFNNSNFLDASNLQQIKVNQCNVFGALADSCALAPGSAQSFEIVFRSFDLSPLDTPALDPLAGEIKSACVDTAGLGEIESDTLLPSGSTNAPIPFLIRTFADPNCTGSSTTFNFKAGLLSVDSATTRIHDFQASAPDVTRILVINSVTPQAPLLDYAGATGTSGTVGVAMSVAPTILNANGAPITNCDISPSLPLGLSINTANCVISGTRSSVLAPTTFSVRAVNSVGSSAPVTVTLDASVAAPMLSYAGSSGTAGSVMVPMSVSPTILSSIGAAITGCTVSPALPSGLSMNTSTCVISGTPTGTLLSTTFTVTATNSAGSTPASVILSVGAFAPTLSFAGATGTSGTPGVPMSVSPTTLSTNGATITGCTIAPSLPAGLSINTSTCLISGTPASALGSTTYTVTATNSAGSTPATVTLIVSAAAPTLSYAGATGTSGTINVPMSISPTTLSTNGATITGCTISPLLPPGLSLHNTTCVISGTLSSALAATPYTVTVTNSAGPSTASVTLTVTACPVNYALVPANPAFGVVSPFCVAQFEMKNVTSIATSQPANQPWVGLSQIAAKSKCTILGANYDLISNPEWMTIATNIENVASNWSGGAVGTGVLNRGHSDNNPMGAVAVLAVTDINDPYNGTLNNAGQAAGSGKEQKRTHTLSNGQVIWDLSGNVWEWTDWSPSPGLQAGPTTCASGWVELLPIVSCGALAAADYMPANPAAHSSTNFGQFFGGTGGSALRGGHYGTGQYTGVYLLHLTSTASTTSTSTGFRCVFRPGAI